MVAVYEVSHKEVPTFVGDQVDAFMTSWVSTKITEDANNVLRDKNRHSKPKSTSCNERWHKAVASSLMHENDRSDITATETAKQVTAKKVAKATFEPSGRHEFSLGLPIVHSIGLQVPTWTTMSPLTYRELPLVWEAVKEFEAYHLLLSRSWLALLLRSGQHILVGENHGAVIAVSEWGYVWLPVHCMVSDGIDCLD